MKAKLMLAAALFFLGTGSVIKGNGESCSAQGCPAKVNSKDKKQMSTLRRSEPVDADLAIKHTKADVLY